MLNAIVFVLRTRVDGKTDFVQRMNSDGKSLEPKALTWVGHGSHGSFYKVLGRMPVQEVFDHELLVRSKRGKLFEMANTGNMTPATDATETADFVDINTL